MTGFDKIKKILVVLGLIMCELFFACAKAPDNAYFIFWNYNENLSLEYLNSHSISECLTKYPDFIRINFSEFQSFNKETTTFIVKSDFDENKLNSMDKQFDDSKDGLLFFSLVVNDKIILNGLNRISLGFLLEQSSFKINTEGHLIIYSPYDNNLRISHRYYFDEDCNNSCLDQKVIDQILQGLH